MHSQLIAIFFVLTISFQAGLIGKECFLCKKIEAERALEQANNPQEVGYYDDYISMLEKEKQKSGEKMAEDKKDNKPDRKKNGETELGE